MTQRFLLPSLAALCMVLSACTQPDSGLMSEEVHSSTSSAAASSVQTIFGTGAAFARELGGRSQAIFVEDGKEIVMLEDKVSDFQNGIYGLSFRDFRISPSKKYVLFTGIGWEWSTGIVYDTSSKKMIVNLDDPGSFELTPDEQSLYTCAANLFSGEIYGRIYDLQTGAVRFSLFEDEEKFKKLMAEHAFITNVECVYQPADDTILFTVVLNEGSVNPVITEKVLVEASTGKVIGGNGQ